MKRSERKSELRIIRSHLISVMDDLSQTRDRLERLDCKNYSQKLESVVGKLYMMVQSIESKEQTLKD